jgi:hypothetical protein
MEEYILTEVETSVSGKSVCKVVTENQQNRIFLSL